MQLSQRFRYYAAKMSLAQSASWLLQLMPMTHVPEIGAENQYQKTCNARKE